MRTLTHFFIIIFVIVSIFIIKDDLRIIYNNVFTYIENYNNNKINIPNFLKESKLTEEVGEEKQVISTPGALRISDKVLSYTSKKVDLSVDEIINETNKNRINISGLEPLTKNLQLNESAQIKLQDIFNKQYFEHISPSGVGVDDLVFQSGYEYIIVGENLALGNFKSNESLLAAWMASPGHRANILNKNYTEIGVAVGRGIFEGKEVWLAIQHFGLPKDICPSINEVLRGKIDLDQENINNLVQVLAEKLKNINSGAVIEGKTRREQIIDYNELVKKYNQIILDIKLKISKYNSGVKLFNECVHSFTADLVTTGE